MPAQIGLEFDKDGLLSLDTNVFDEAVAEDYMGVLAVIGADKTGSSDSGKVAFYGASNEYTTAGKYDVEVKVESGVITVARIKLATGSEYRDATITGNIITGDSTFDSNGDPVYPENGLQLSVDLGTDFDYTGANSITVRVKQGFAGAMEDVLDRVLKVTTGSIQIDQEYVEEHIEHLQQRIDDEEERLAWREERLIMQFARLEKTLALLQNQLSALGFGSA
jgi:flagellar capping protein FliD